MLHGRQQNLFDLSFAVPSAVADSLESGAADIGIVPCAELDRLQLEYLPDTGIACRGPVRSILLITKRRPEDIRTIAGDVSSRSSVLLARIIVAERYGATPQVVSMAPDPERMLEACDAALVIGAEKMTDRAGPEVTSALAAAADAEFEVLTGVSFVALNALLMRRYLHEFGAPREAFGEFVVNAHDNAVTNPSAMFGYRTSIQDYLKAKPIADPINLLDSAPVCDGAAALVLCSEELARAEGLPAVRIRAVEVATDTLAVHDRHDPLTLRAAALSSSRAFERAALRPEDMDVLELHDAFSIMAVLSLEANGFAERGRGWKLGLDGSIRRNGRLPISTLGGLKARGHPVGATGVYQVSELTRQLRGEAGENQIPRARLGMAQSIGGSGATVVTTILESTL
jgi:acetyl-CoA C-acetyltransferase